jgi:hypothetical protein
MSIYSSVPRNIAPWYLNRQRSRQPMNIGPIYSLVNRRIHVTVYSSVNRWTYWFCTGAQNLPVCPTVRAVPTLHFWTESPLPLTCLPPPSSPGHLHPSTCCPAAPGRLRPIWCCPGLPPPLEASLPALPALALDAGPPTPGLCPRRFLFFQICIEFE